MRHLRYALRALLKTPFVTSVAVVSLGLGIGANAAIFSLFDGLLLRPLPVQEPSRLVDLGSPGPKPGSQSCGNAGDCDEVWSYPMFRDLEKGQTVFTGIAAHVIFGVNLALAGHTPTSGAGMLVSGSYFPVLGLAPASGRLLGPADDQAIGGNPLAVLSYGYWQSKLGADPTAVGKTIVVNGQSLTIVGVAPRGFTGTTLGTDPAVFVPISMRAMMVPGWKGFENRRSYWAYLFARLKPGVTLAQAQEGINRLYKPILTDVEAPLQKGMSDKTMAAFRARTVSVEDGRRGQSTVHAEVKTPLTMLFALTGLVLLIACANIANLLLARGANRASEMAVRLSLGAGRGQLLRQLLTESIVLSLLGGAASLLVARWTIAGMMAILPTSSAQAFDFGLETPVVVFTALLSLSTGILFGLFPALHSTRPDLISSIRANAGQLAGARAASRFRSSLVTAQIALSMALLVSAGLFIRSLVNVSRVDLGITTDHLVTFSLSPVLNGSSNANSVQFFRRTEEQLAAIPGVTGVTTTLVPLIAGDNWGNSVSVEGHKKVPDANDNSSFNEVAPGHFKTTGIPLLSGREFTRSDEAGSAKVAIVNEAFAKKFDLGRAAVGKHMSVGNDSLDIEIVGLVKDSKYSDVKREAPAVYYTPIRQDTTRGSVYFYVRTAIDPRTLVRDIPTLIAKMDPALPVDELRTMPQQIREQVFLDRMISTLSAAFAVLATLLAAIGLYGVLAYSVSQRTREIGVRMALGADQRQVRGMVVRQVARMTLIGGAIGIGGAILLGKTAKSLLFGLTGADPVGMVASALLLTFVALGAGYLPARRASRVHPMQALRYE